MEIDRFLEVRTRIEVDRRFSLGAVVAKAWHDPKALSEDMQAWQVKKRGVHEDDGYESDGSDVIALFEQQGLSVVDTTKH